MKQVILAIAIAMFAGSAMATTGTVPESWTASGYRSIQGSNNATVSYLPIDKITQTEQLCHDYILDQKNLALGLNAAGGTQKHKVDATCSQVKGAVAP